MGSGDKRLQLVRDALAENRPVLIRQAIRLATGKKPNVVVLCKLLDKILPSLHCSEINGDVLMQPVRIIRDLPELPSEKKGL
jgi:hypothetical protein